MELEFIIALGWGQWHVSFRWRLINVTAPLILDTKLAPSLDASSFNSLHANKKIKHTQGTLGKRYNTISTSLHSVRPLGGLSLHTWRIFKTFNTKIHPFQGYISHKNHYHYRNIVHRYCIYLDATRNQGSKITSKTSILSGNKNIYSFWWIPPMGWVKTNIITYLL